MRRQTKPNWRTFYKKCGLYSSQCQCHKRERQTEELFWIKGDYRGIMTKCDPGLCPTPGANVPYRTWLGQLTVVSILFPEFNNCSMAIKENTLGLWKYTLKYIKGHKVIRYATYSQIARKQGIMHTLHMQPKCH